MRVLDRTETENALRALGVTKDSVHGTGCFDFGPDETAEAVVVIEEFDRATKGPLLTILVGELLRVRPIWWLLPKITYFGEKPWSADQWAAQELPPLRNEVIEWSADDLPKIDKLLTTHCEAGWNVGWDLYLASTDGRLLAFVDHHEQLSVSVRRREEAQLLSTQLSARGVSNAIYPETDA